MSTLEPRPRPAQREGRSIVVSLIATLVFALLGLAALGTVIYFMGSEKRRLADQVARLELKEKENEVARRQGEEDAKRLQAESRQREVLAQVRAATTALEQLLAEINAVTADAAALRTNAAGQGVALHPQLVPQARTFYDVSLRELPAAPDVITRLEDVRGIGQQLLDKTGTAYLPDAQLAVSAQNAALTAGLQREKTRQIRDLLTSLVRESERKYTTEKVTAASPTLEAALQQLSEAETAAARRTLAEQTTTARDQAAQTVADAERRRIIEEAKVEAAKILAAAQEKKAQLDNELALAAANRKKDDAAARDNEVKALEEARKIALRTKASDPRNLGKLTPFTTPGYRQNRGMTADKHPWSYSGLQAAGALQSNLKGMDRLVELAVDKKDTVRPRWPYHPNFWGRDPDNVAKIKEAQDLLIELGPTLVELKLLEP